MRATQYSASRQSAGAVVRKCAERIRAVLRGSQIPPVVAVENDVIYRSRSIDHEPGDRTRVAAGKAADQAGGDVEALAVDGPGGQPQRVVLDVRQVIAGQRPRARQVAAFTIPGEKI